MKPSTTVVARFWSKVQRSSGCWEWTGSLQSGYGQLRVCTDSRVPMARAHRVSWEIHYGPVPDDLCVLHRCDNRKCVRPDHLFVGTRRDNARDMVAKGRHHRAHLRGERHPSARLNAAGAAEVLRRARGGESLTSLARAYGISISAVWALKNGRTWKELSR